MTRLNAARAGETLEVFSLDAQTARDTTRKTREPNDDRLTTDPEPQQIRGTSQDFEQFSNGDVQIEMNRPRKDGGPENADAWQALERVDDRTRCASWEGACRTSARSRHRRGIRRPRRSVIVSPRGRGLARACDRLFAVHLFSVSLD